MKVLYFDIYFSLILLWYTRLRNLIDELSENVNDLGAEIETISNEKFNLELRFKDQKRKYEQLQVTSDQSHQLCANLEIEKNGLIATVQKNENTIDELQE